MSGNKYILKLDNDANTSAYNEALLYFESLGFRGKTASDLAIEKVHNNVLFDAGSLPDVDVVAKAWGDGDDTSRRENYQNARKAARESEKKVQQHEMNQSIRNATDKWGYGIGSGLEMISGFTPLWWVAPAVRTGLNLSEGDYKGVALNTGLAFAAPYAIGKGILYVTPYAKSAIIANILNKQIKNTKLSKPLAKLDLLDGYLFHNGHVEVSPAGYNGKKYTYILREAKPGALKIEKGKYKSVRQPYGDNSDLIWWDAEGHNYGKKVYVTKLGNDATHVISNMENLPISQVIERYEPSYYITKLKPVNSVIEYTFDPISGSPIPHMPGKVLNNKMSYKEVLTLPIQVQPKTTPSRTSLAFFERQPTNISDAERLGISKHDRHGLGDFNTSVDWRPNYYYSDSGRRSGYSKTWELSDDGFLFSHIPEYLRIEKSSKHSGNWLKNLDGSKFEGDPRSWIMMLSKAFLKSGLYPDIKVVSGTQSHPFPINSDYDVWGVVPEQRDVAASFGYNPNTKQTITYSYTYPKNVKELIVTLPQDGIPYHSIPKKYIPNLNELSSENVLWTDAIVNASKDNGYEVTRIQNVIEGLSDGMPVTDVIIHKGTPRKIVEGSNGEFNLKDKHPFRKSGGTIKIKKKNKGKFAKVRDYVDYKNSK